MNVQCLSVIMKKVFLFLFYFMYASYEVNNGKKIDIKKLLLSAFSFLVLSGCVSLLLKTPYMHSSYNAVNKIMAVPDDKEISITEWQAQLNKRSEALSRIVGLRHTLVVDAKDPLVPVILKQIDTPFLPTYEPKSVLSETPQEKKKYGYDTYLWLDILVSHYADSHESAAALYRQAMLYERLYDDSRSGSFAYSVPFPEKTLDTASICFVRLAQLEHRAAGVFYDNGVIPLARSLRRVWQSNETSRATFLTHEMGHCYYSRHVNSEEGREGRPLLERWDNEVYADIVAGLIGMKLTGSTDLLVSELIPIRRLEASGHKETWGHFSSSVWKGILSKEKGLVERVSALSFPDVFRYAYDLLERHQPMSDEVLASHIRKAEALFAFRCLAEGQYTEHDDIDDCTRRVFTMEPYGVEAATADVRRGIVVAGYDIVQSQVNNLVYNGDLAPDLIEDRQAQIAEDIAYLLWYEQHDNASSKGLSYFSEKPYDVLLQKTGISAQSDASQAGDDREAAKAFLAGIPRS